MTPNPLSPTPSTPPTAATLQPAAADPLGLTVGPVLYHWPRQQLVDFYAAVAESPADTVVIGEVVCARRRELRLNDWLDLARDLAQAGKNVVLAAQALIETEADLRLLERQGEQSDFAVEAADASALQLLSGRVPLVLGPHLNIYSRAALVEHAGLGAWRWVAPIELSLDDLAAINPPDDPVLTPDGAPLRSEVWAFGRVPLSFSARCFTARHHGLPKDGCGYRCIEDADGLPMLTSERQPFLVLNGTQTQSAGVQCLLHDLPALRAAGVRSLRLSPCAQGFDQVLRDFAAVAHQGEPPGDRLARWAALGVPGPFSNGYARHQPGMAWSVPR
ncbi:MAG TPA: U32 family peptidase [Burkholderiaceae bacterium]|nr:U32 family peptidase [Burkholderiaceae bacterium]HNG79626.1 U32 family peptidase [Burkholderiaceae bacterium]